MIIRYPKCLEKNLRVDRNLIGHESRKGYREILEQLDEEYVLNLVARKKVDSNYYRNIFNDIDKEYIEEMI